MPNNCFPRISTQVLVPLARAVRQDWAIPGAMIRSVSVPGCEPRALVSMPSPVHLVSLGDLMPQKRSFLHFHIECVTLLSELSSSWPWFPALVTIMARSFPQAKMKMAEKAEGRSGTIVAHHQSWRMAASISSTALVSFESAAAAHRHWTSPATLAWADWIQKSSLTR